MVVMKPNQNALPVGQWGSFMGGVSTVPGSAIGYTSTVPGSAIGYT